MGREEPFSVSLSLGLALCPSPPPFCMGGTRLIMPGGEGGGGGSGGGRQEKEGFANDQNQ